MHACGKRHNVLGQLHGRLQALCRAPSNGSPAPFRAPPARNPSSGEDQVERAAVSDEPRQTHRAEVHQRHSESAAIHAEHGVFRGDAQIAPDRQFQPSRYRMTFHRRDHRLGQQHPGRTHRPVAIFPQRRAAPLRDRFQIVARAESPATAGQNRYRECFIGIEGPERVRQRRCGCRIDRVARLRPVDRHHQNAAAPLRLYHQASRTRAACAVATGAAPP